jgi:hypothetical protein
MAQHLGESTPCRQVLNRTFFEFSCKLMDYRLHLLIADRHQAILNMVTLLG